MITELENDKNEQRKCLRLTILLTTGTYSMKLSSHAINFGLNLEIIGIKDLCILHN